MALFYGILRSSPVFWVSEVEPQPFLAYYARYDRDIWRQQLPLSAEQAAELAEALAENARPENRYYAYHHYYDNCSTRLRDLIDEAIGGKLRSEEPVAVGPTYRDFTNQGVAAVPALVILSDLALGPAVDREPDHYAAAFLPDHLRALVTERLGVRPERIYRRLGPDPDTEIGWARAWYFVVAAILAFPLLLPWLRRLPLGLRFAWALWLPSLVGLLFWVVAILSSLAELRYNLTALVLMPTDFALVFMGDRHRRMYGRVRLGLIGALLLLWVFGIVAQPVYGPAACVLVPLVVAALRPWRE